MSIADVVIDCAETFQRVRSDLTDRCASDEGLQTTYTDFLNEASACFERFQLWSSNLGAHRRDKNSLDRRLREASNLQGRVLQYLKDIQEGLKDIIDIISGKTTPWDEESESSSGDLDLDDEAEVDTELGQLIRYVDNAVSCLLRISTVIQKPAPHDRFIKSGKFDQSFRQQWDEQHVSDKFADLPKWMAARLGKANSRRRQFLEYRKSQHEQIADLQPIEDENKTIISSLPSAIKKDKSLQNMAGSEPACVIDELDDRQSQTSYAGTVANEDALLVPAMPDNATEGALFECPYCFLIVSGIHNRMQWKRHVYTDLQPYICLHPECISADETFARWHDWINHDTRSHRKRWCCSLGCNADFSSKTHIRDHLVEVHGLHGASDHHLNALSVHTDIETPKSLACPLCNQEFSALTRYYKHVGRHLEQLALFVIPRDCLEEVDEDMEDSKSRVSVDADVDMNDAEVENIEGRTESRFEDELDSMMNSESAIEEERQPDDQSMEVDEQAKEHFQQPSYLFFDDNAQDDFVDPSSTEEPPQVRVWPGMHQQAALAKAKAQAQAQQQRQTQSRSSELVEPIQAQDSSSPTTSDDKPFSTRDADLASRSRVGACNRCRLRKNRYDLRLPSCASCEKAGVNCVGYDPITKREIPRSVLQSSMLDAPPGPVPATSPLVVRQDQNGVQWIAFEYVRDRVKIEYTIRCDVELIDIDELPQEFKIENCVYPRAMVNKDQYKGNRLHYETECNVIGWALAQLNTCLRGKRGVLQRAVDSWRNSNPDSRLRSRHVVTMSNMNIGNKAATEELEKAEEAPGVEGSDEQVSRQPTFHCESNDCEYSVRGFDSQAALDSHVAQMHVKKDHHFQRALESMEKIVDPSIDHELALALKMTLEAENAIKDKKKRSADMVQGITELEPVVESEERQSVRTSKPVETPRSTSPDSGRRQNQWFVPGEGISQNVIEADIRYYLGPDALVRSGMGRGEYEGTPGYWVTAYKNLTSQQIQDLKLDSQPKVTKQHDAAGRRAVAADPPTMNLKIFSLSAELVFPSIHTNSSVKELRRRIQAAVPSRPAPERMRLVCRGRVLANENETLGSVFGAENIRANKEQSFHLVLHELSLNHDKTSLPRHSEGYLFATDGSQHPLSQQSQQKEVAIAEEESSLSLAKSPQQELQLLSCTECRERKIKCDRTTPCSACFSRRRPEDCQFVVEGGDDASVQRAYEIRKLTKKNLRMKKRLRAYGIYVEDKDYASVHELQKLVEEHLDLRDCFGNAGLLFKDEDNDSDIAASSKLKASRSQQSLFETVEKYVEPTSNATTDRRSSPSEFSSALAATSTKADSPDEAKRTYLRRESFANTLGRRTSNDSLMDLDEYFPDAKLDQSMLEEGEDTYATKPIRR